MKLRYTVISLILIFALLLSACGKTAGTDDPLPGTGEESATVSEEVFAGPEGTEPETTAPEETEQVTSTPEETEPAISDPEETEPETTAPEEKYTFEPHIYSPLLSSYYPQEWWESFYHLCDALRAGKDTFECASKEVYDWCTDDVTLAQLFPAACLVVKGEGSDGSVPFENGIGRIYYVIPPEEYVVRQAGFEALIEEILNSVLEPDDTDFEKCFKLYDYIESTYTYGYESHENEGYVYNTFLHRQGVCENLSGIYVYLLHQVGIDALNIGCFDEGIDHAWTYLILDGEGYHTDPTWALYEEGGFLDLSYFLNSEEARNRQGVPTGDLTAGMVPGFWLEYTETVLPAASEKYACLNGAVFVSLDEESKTLCYEDCLGMHEMKYE